MKTSRLKGFIFAFLLLLSIGTTHAADNQSTALEELEAALRDPNTKIITTDQVVPVSLLNNSSKTSLSLSTPKEGDVIVAESFQLRGTGPAGASVMVTINDADLEVPGKKHLRPGFMRGVAVVDSQGEWQYAPAQTLLYGTYSVQVAHQTEDGTVVQTPAIHFTLTSQEGDTSQFAWSWQSAVLLFIVLAIALVAVASFRHQRRLRRASAFADAAALRANEVDRLKEMRHQVGAAESRLRDSVQKAADAGRTISNSSQDPRALDQAKDLLADALDEARAAGEKLEEVDDALAEGVEDLSEHDQPDSPKKNPKR